MCEPCFEAPCDFDACECECHTVIVPTDEEMEAAKALLELGKDKG
jgi:hypothetical protein